MTSCKTSREDVGSKKEEDFESSQAGNYHLDLFASTNNKYKNEMESVFYPLKPIRKVGIKSNQDILLVYVERDERRMEPARSAANCEGFG